jgi:hypothetical protein
MPRSAAEAFPILVLFQSARHASLGIGRAAGIVLAARRRTIRAVDQNIVMTRGAHQAIDGFAELIVTHFGSVLGARLFTAHGHFGHPFTTMVSTAVIL